MMLSVFAFVAFVAGVQATLQRPDYDTWKESKANATLDAEAKAAREAKMAAVNKVVSMLQGLQTQVLAEGEQEAQTYNKFACFCQDTTAEKTEAIQKGTDEKASLSSTIESLAQERDTLDTEIATLLSDIETAETEMKQAKDQRAAELSVYEKNEADLSGAIEALEGAIKVMKASKPSLLQMKMVSDTLRTAVLMADTLGLGGEKTKNAATAFLQQEQAPDVEMENYKFHSSDIIETLEGLLRDFRSEKEEVDAEEVRSVAAHDSLIQEKTDLIKAKNVELEDAKKTKEKKIEEIASNTAELTTVAATLLDDQQYLMELHEMCSQKAQTWDQRSKVRQDELHMLTSVIKIISTSVAGNTTAATIRFMQQSVGKRAVEAIAANPRAMMALEADAEAEDVAPASFLQRQSARVARSNFLAPKNQQGARDAIVALFRSKGETLKSTVLTSLAGKISEDPFAKIKMLIQELIERLLKEQSAEANQKGWCDKSLADAEQKRDYAAAAVEELNSEMATLEAKRDTLTADLDTLSTEIADLQNRRTEAETMRTKEKNENGMTISEAEAGLSALTMAIDIIDKFYKTVAKETVEYSMAQQSPFDDAPDAGFDNGEAYTGSQGATGGIIGMLDVMKSDFQRTISETEKAEAQAEADHLAFMTETGKSLATKQTAHSEKTTQKDDAEEQLSEASDGLTSQMDILTTSISELKELKPACIDTGMSYEDRVARREAEIEALKKGLCILDAFAEFGPDGAGAEC